MNARGWIIVGSVLLLAALAPCTAAAGQDMRELEARAREAREALVGKAKAEAAAARQEAARERERITQDRAALAAALKAREAAVRELEEKIKTLETDTQALAEQETRLTKALARTSGEMRELVGGVRACAKDIQDLIGESLQGALAGPDTGFLEEMAGQSRFPGLDDIRRMIALLWEEVRSSGQVRLTRGPMVDRDGNAVEAEILLLGNFTAAYRTAAEAGFLTRAPAGRTLFALSRLPSRRMEKALRAYMDGEGEAVPMDISRGGALSQLTHEQSLWRQVPKGGPLVWPILAVLSLGAGIVLERLFFLWRRRADGDALTRRIAALAAGKDWPACREACRRMAKKPLARVMAAGLDAGRMGREAMENALQEAILREVPPMERFLSTLGMLAAIAPLLGLLGTVTGMIDTFHVITRFGTGDPRMMSGGISEALVTTMLGLSVAIPLMLAHTLLGREVDRRIGQMEEKAVALVNLVEKHGEGA